MKPSLRSTFQFGVSVCTLLALLALALLPLLTPLTHLLLDSAGSAERLDATSTQAYAWSDATIHQMIWGSSDFSIIAGPDGMPLYSATEAAHLQTVQVALRILLGLGLITVTAIGASLIFLKRYIDGWRAVGRGGLWLMVTVAVAALFSLVGFERAWRLFHKVLFPAGNYSFRSSSDHLVQLYPTDFWAGFVGILGGTAFVLAATVWVITHKPIRFTLKD